MQDAKWYLDQGHRLSKERKFVSAELSFRKALDLDASLAMAHNNLGYVIERKGEVNEAVLCYKRALELSPSLLLAQVNLSALLYRLKRFDEAKPLVSSFLSTYPCNRELLDQFIGLALRSGDFDGASLYADRHAALGHGSRWFNLQEENIRFPAVPFLSHFLRKKNLHIISSNSVIYRKEGY